MERRCDPRIPFQAPAFLVKNGKPVFSQVRDISNKGLFVDTTCTYDKDDSTQVAIYFLEGPITLSVTVPCKVARHAESGVGLTSSEIDPKELLFFERLLREEHADSAKLMESFYEFFHNAISSTAH